MRASRVYFGRLILEISGILFITGGPCNSQIFGERENHEQQHPPVTRPTFDNILRKSVSKSPPIEMFFKQNHELLMLEFIIQYPFLHKFQFLCKFSFTKHYFGQGIAFDSVMD